MAFSNRPPRSPRRSRRPPPLLPPPTREPLPRCLNPHPLGDKLMASFSTALSGLKADTTAIDVVGNNLANLNTTGFKASAVSFQDLVTQSIGAGLGATQVGFGVGIPITLRQFTQGAIQS